MASKFETEYESAFERMLDLHGDDITYTPVGGSAVSITAIVSEQDADQTTELDARYFVREAEVVFARRQSEEITPARDDVVNWDGIDWPVISVPDRDAEVVTVLVRAVTSRDRSHERFKRVR